MIIHSVRKTFEGCTKKEADMEKLARELQGVVWRISDREYKDIASI